jgi:diguanylate cyclase (GGDEF)-like protein
VEQLESLTCSDELTALQNRRGFWTLARLQLKTAERLGCRAFFFFVDLDRLKEINDTYGHKEGDAALKRIACVLASAFRSSDILARFSGDEFVILCLDVAREGSEVIIERLMVHVNHDNSVHSAPYALSISVGCAEFDPANPVSLEQLMVMADKAMYSNKNAKRQRLGSG